MVRINAVLREDIVEGIDEIAKETGESRSSLLRDAAQRLIKEYRHQNHPEYHCGSQFINTAGGLQFC